LCHQTASTSFSSDQRDAAVSGFGLTYIPEEIVSSYVADGKLKRVLETFASVRCLGRGASPPHLTTARQTVLKDISARADIPPVKGGACRIVGRSFNGWCGVPDFVPKWRKGCPPNSLSSTIP
jgi:hypothetical protein